ncbi:hypothetical protein ACVWYH_010376 [Bradyrhizobium sp. GM24.11]
MNPAWTYLDEQDRSLFRSAVAFLDDRLTESATIEWAAQLGSDKRVERAAIDHLLNNPNGRLSREPWAAAYRLIEESWSEKPIERGSSSSIYNIQARLRAGDRSGAVITAIVDLVAPRLRVRPVSSSRRQFTNRTRAPTTVSQLLSASLTSGDLVDLTVLELETFEDVPFLRALASSLESAIDHGLDIGRRIGWDGQRRIWQLGDLNRVYYLVPGGRTQAGLDDPDAYNYGIAPAVKLLYEVVSRLVSLDVESELAFVRRWRLTSSLVHSRLWAAAARNSRLILPADVAEFFSTLADENFWDLHAYPEIAELRAARFGELNAAAQKTLTARLLKGPPRRFWPKTTEKKKVKERQLHWTVRELKRIELAGVSLPPDAKRCLDSNVVKFPDLAGMSGEAGYPEGVQVREVSADPDNSYDDLNGVPRLRALETALGSERRSLNNDPSQRADDWLRLPTKTLLVLDDLEVADRGGSEFARVWDRFGWTHAPGQPDATGAVHGDSQQEAERVLALLVQLSEATIAVAVDGISSWLERWRFQVVASQQGLAAWKKTWPAAVAATNNQAESEDKPDLSVTATATDREPRDLDTLNTPAGRLVGVFLVACAPLEQIAVPFAVGTDARQMRDALIVAHGRSGLIARHRLIQALPYFLKADRQWTQDNLVAPLLSEEVSSLTLWRAVARATRFKDVLEVIGDAMAQRATDRRLGRQIRGRLAFSVVVEALHAFREQRPPVLPNARISQMIRNLDDEVRATAANSVQQFVGEISAKPGRNGEQSTVEELFRSAAVPFLRDVWPQERSLSTPGVSKAFADLPATCREAFAEAVSAIERFLVPFECWSMLDYGLYGEQNGVKKLAIIDNEAKASALLLLLNLTVGTSEGSVVPYDLTDALDQVRSVEPRLSESMSYRRLSTAARRV